MKPAVALAMLEREGGWMLQLRDDIDSIIYPGHWGLFGGHLDPGETASDAVHRELKEEIDWSPSSHWNHGSATTAATGWPTCSAKTSASP